MSFIIGIRLGMAADHVEIGRKHGAITKAAEKITGRDIAFEDVTISDTTVSFHYEGDPVNEDTLSEAIATIPEHYQREFFLENI